MFYRLGFWRSGQPEIRYVWFSVICRFTARDSALHNMSVRDWSLFTGGGGGVTKLENRGSKTFCGPQGQGKTSLPSLPVL